MLIYSNSENNTIFGDSNVNVPFKYVKKNEFLKQYNMFSVGYMHAVIITKEGHAMAIGNDENFLIGTDKRIVYRTFTRVTFNKHNAFQAVFCGSDYSIYLASDSTLIYCHQKRKKNMIAEHHLDAQPVLLSGGFNRPIVLDSNGDIHIFSSVDPYIKPKLVHLQQRIACVCGGIYFTVVVTESGEVKASGSLGNKTEDFIDITQLKGIKFVQVAGNHSHCLLLTQNGDVYSAGWNLFGQLGRGNEQDSFEFQKITALNGIKVVSIAAGYLHSVFLTDDKSIYVCGSNFYNQLFLKNKNQKILTPMLVDEYKNKVEAIYVGQFSTYLRVDEKIALSKLTNANTTSQSKKPISIKAKQEAMDENTYQANIALSQQLNDSLDREKILLDKVKHLQSMLEQKEIANNQIPDEQLLANCKLISEMTNEVENTTREKNMLYDQILDMKNENALLKKKCADLQSKIDLLNLNITIPSNDSNAHQDQISDQKDALIQTFGIPNKDQNEKIISELTEEIEKLKNERNISNSQIDDLKKDIEMLRKSHSKNIIPNETTCETNFSCPINLILTIDDLKNFTIKDNTNDLVPKMFSSSLKSTVVENSGECYVERTYTNIDTNMLFSIYHMNCPFLDKITGFAQISNCGNIKYQIMRKYYERTLTDAINSGQLNFSDKKLISLGIAYAFMKVRSLKYQYSFQNINLKVENIMLSNNNKPIFVDYVKNNSSSFSTTIASTNYIYLAPEIVREESSNDEITTVYSFGIVLYYLFFGHLPQEKLVNIMNNKEIKIPAAKQNDNLLTNDNNMLSNDNLLNNENLIMKKIILLIQHCISPYREKRPSFRKIFFYLATLNDNMKSESTNEVLDLINDLILKKD